MHEKSIVTLPDTIDLLVYRFECFVEAPNVGLDLFLLFDRPAADLWVLEEVSWMRGQEIDSATNEAVVIIRRFVDGGEFIRHCATVARTFHAEYGVKFWGMFVCEEGVLDCEATEHLDEVIFDEVGCWRETRGPFLFLAFVFRFPFLDESDAHSELVSKFLALQRGE